MAVTVERSIAEYRIAVAYCLLYLPVEVSSLNGAPSAFALYAILCYSPWSVVSLDDSDVGLISLSQEATFLYRK